MNNWKDNLNINENKTRRKYFFAKSLKGQTIAIIISVLVVFAIMFGTSYAIFSSVNKSEDYNGVKVGNLQITYNEESGAVSLANAFPMSDEDGLKSDAYSFSIQNTGSLATTYSIKLLDDKAVIDGEEKSDSEMANKLLNKNDIKVSVNGEVPVILENLSINDYEILNGKLQPGETKKVQVRIWIKSDASNDIFYKNTDGSLSGKYYFGKITVEGENTKTYETDNMLLWLDGKNKTGYTLPYGYKQVEYLESTGTQYIDTGYYPKIDTKVEMDLSFNGTFKTTGSVFISSYNSSVSNDIFQVNFSGSRSTTMFFWLKKTRSSGAQIIETALLDTIIKNRNTLVLDRKTGLVTYGTSKLQAEAATGDVNDTLKVFASYNNTPFEAYNMRLYSLKIYTGDALDRYYIPCLDNNGVPCMYDTVSKQTFYNANNGTDFSYGKTMTSEDLEYGDVVWRDLSEHNDYDMSNFSNYSWNNNGLKINANNLTDIGLKYNVNSLDTYTVSTSLKLSSNSGSINLIDNNDINIYISSNRLMYGNTDSGLTLDSNKLYTVTLVKRKKYTMKTDGTKESRTVLETYVNGEFNKDITNANKVDVTGSNINIDIYNYLVYGKALSINEEANNYRLTLERYGS